MTTNNPLSRLPSNYLGYLSLLFWCVVTLFLLRHDLYSLDEGAAKSLLLIWSISDNVASSVVTFGAPDLRTVLFAPAGILWTGNIFAPKIFTVLALAFAAYLLHAWSRRNGTAESALLSTGLLIISPLALQQIDMLSPGIYLLLAFALGAWLNDAYRANPSPFGGWYFSQLLIIALCVSLHPAGLAYPLALFWAWQKDPINKIQQKYFFIGIGFVTLFTLLVRMGWTDLEWLQNPLKSLAHISLGASLNGEMTTARWIAGGLTLAALIFIAVKQYNKILSDFTGRTLFLALAIGSATSDSAWSLIALCVVLYFGLPLLLGPAKNSSAGFIQARGSALLLVIVLSTIFMLADKSHYLVRQSGILSSQDRLIKTLADEAENVRKSAEANDGAIKSGDRLRVASQWPSRTMIACQCDTLPLPPAAKDPQAQLAMLHSITHLLFNPQQPGNILLSRNLSLLGGATETIALEPGGVLLRLKNTNIPKDK